MEITILESNPDKGLLRKLTFCFSADLWQARANGGSGGGGFFLAGEDFGRMFNHSFPVCIFFFFFVSGNYRAHTDFHSLCQDQSTVAQFAETTVADYSLTSCV